MTTERRIADPDKANVVGNLVYNLIQPLLGECEVQNVVLGLCCALVAVGRQHGVTAGSLKEVLNCCLKAEFIRLARAKGSA